MRININKDIELYEEDFMLGLSLKEALSVIAAFISGIIFIFALQFFMPLILSVYIGIIPSVLIAFFVFYKPSSGLSVSAHIKRKRILRNAGKLVIKSTDIPDMVSNTKTELIKDNMEIKKYLILLFAILVIIITVSICIIKKFK